MPIQPTYPGVYIEELPSGVRTIVGVATSITAFVGRAKQGPIDYPVRISSYGDYERAFGGLWGDSSMSYAVRQFFQNGGTDAIIVRVTNGSTPAARNAGGFHLSAAWKGEANDGIWGNHLSFAVDTDVTKNEVFNLTIRLHEDTTLASPTVATETFRNLSTDPAAARYIETVLEQESFFVQVEDATILPAANTFAPNTAAVEVAEDMLTAGGNGNTITDTEIQGSLNNKTGIYALEDTDLFNLLYIPQLAPGSDVAPAAMSEALDYCIRRRAMLIVDPPVAWNDVAAARTGVSGLTAGIGGAGKTINAIGYFPNMRMPDPLRENRQAEFPPGGAIAGLIARTDANRGVWKAPAGIEASFVGVSAMEVKITEPENGQLNQLGLNCLRSITPYGHLSWGSRTLAGDDRIASEWKYIPVRRTALYIEESLYRGLHWVVFEPNGETLWGQIRLNVGSFMQNLFRKGAFQGSSARDAYIVKCDAETNPQNLIDQGVVTVYVGFAALKPAEFVFIQIQQLAGQLEV